MNSFNDGKFGYNNLQECIVSYSHKFDDKWWTTFEGQYMYMNDCTTAPTKAVPYQNGFYPTHAGFVPEGGILNYTMRRIAPNAFLTFRNEWFDDTAGARTGYPSDYYEGSVGITWWPNKLMCVRPEIRYDHSFRGQADVHGTIMHGAYDNGTKQDQVTLAADVTYHF